MVLKKALESYANLYLPIKKENFDETTGMIIPQVSIIHMLISWIVVGFAIYLSFRCHGEFKLGSFLLAFFCSPCYILYHLATSGLCGLI
jgi:hypothetical protein